MAANVRRIDGIQSTVIFTPLLALKKYGNVQPGELLIVSKLYPLDMSFFELKSTTSEDKKFSSFRLRDYSKHYIKQRR